MSATHVAYRVPAGFHTLAFEIMPEDPQAHRDLRFVFGGRHTTLRVQRIVAARYGAPDIVFDDATLHEVTVWFARNPIGYSNDHTFRIGLLNFGTEEELLQVTALSDPAGPPLDPPPGL